MNKLQRGFAALEGLLILVIVALIGGMGYYVWQSKQQTDKNLNNSVSSSQSTPAVTKSTRKTTAHTTSTVPDKELIASAIADKCHSVVSSLDESKVKAANLDMFSKSSSNLVVQGNYSSANGTCAESLTPGAGLAFLFKKTEGSWTFVYYGQNQVNCEAVDNQGWPSSVLDQCYDSNTQDYRAPK